MKILSDFIIDNRASSLQHCVLQGSPGTWDQQPRMFLMLKDDARPEAFTQALTFCQEYSPDEEVALGTSEMIFRG